MPSLTLVAADRLAVPCTPRVSFRPDPQLLDDRPPFFRISFHERAERLRRLLFARENFLAELGEPGSHRWRSCPHGHRSKECFRARDTLQGRSAVAPSPAAMRRDLVRGLKQPDHGRRGLTAPQVLRALVALPTARLRSLPPSGSG